MVKVNQKLCIGCGACAAICPKGFKLNPDFKAEVVSQDDGECAKKAVESCPVQAISMEK